MWGLVEGGPIGNLEDAIASNSFFVDAAMDASKTIRAIDGESAQPYEVLENLDFRLAEVSTSGDNSCAHRKTN